MASRSQKGATVLSLVAILALLIGTIAGPPATASGGDGTATAAKKKKKKKCKPGFKKVVIKKKGKKKVKCKRIAPAVPVVRATLTWFGVNPDINLDLFVFDSNGASGSPASNSIPNTSFSPNAPSAFISGLESFTDLAPVPARNFSFGICYGPPDFGSEHAYARIDYVTADGQHHVVGTTDTTSTIDLGSKGAHVEFDGGAPIPANYCN
jgi:hypothetical protein